MLDLTHGHRSQENHLDELPGKRAITADTALRLARYFGTSEQFWMGLQSDFDLEEARKQLGRKIDAIERAAA